MASKRLRALRTAEDCENEIDRIIRAIDTARENERYDREAARIAAEWDVALEQQWLAEYDPAWHSFG